jgi:putative sugar O-methyltransferase
MRYRWQVNCRVALREEFAMGRGILGLVSKLFREPAHQQVEDNEPAHQQVEDNLDVLEQALAQFERADALYHPGPYWQRHQEPLITYLRKNGLANYRRGAIDKRDPQYVFNRFGAAVPKVRPPKHMSDKQWQAERYRFAASYGAICGAKPLANLSMSTFGNPGDAFSYGGNTYTHLSLNLYMRYSYLCQFIDFDRISTVAEIGPGSGLQTEILHKLHPHLTSYLFDIPPQSYVCCQYLRAVFPEKVTPLEATADLTATPSPLPGQINIFNSWQVPLLGDLPIDLFWNAASFNEMEPHLVQNYLSLVRGRTTHLYLMSIMAGSRVGMDDYASFLPCHSCSEVEPVIFANGALSPQYKNSFWRRG